MIIWVDLETTGLFPDTCCVLEVAVIVTDDNLNTIEELPSLFINQPDDILDNMNEWCMKQHGKSGLTDRCRASTTCLSEAEEIILSCVKKHTTSGVCPLAGNSVSFDKNFLIKHMPKFASFLHYQIIDVTSVKLLAKSWYPEEFKLRPKKEESHTALADIKESIAELKYYRENIFK